jgi:hypothetical protein
MTKSQAKKLSDKIREEQVKNEQLVREKQANNAEAKADGTAFIYAPEPLIDKVVRKATFEGIGEMVATVYSVKFDGKEYFKATYQDAFKLSQEMRKSWREEHGNILTLAKFRGKIAAEQKRIEEMLATAGLPVPLLIDLKKADEALKSALAKLPAAPAKKDTTKTDETADATEIDMTAADEGIMPQDADEGVATQHS